MTPQTDRQTKRQSDRDGQTDIQTEAVMTATSTSLNGKGISGRLRASAAEEVPTTIISTAQPHCRDRKGGC